MCRSSDCDSLPTSHTELGQVDLPQMRRVACNELPDGFSYECKCGFQANLSSNNLIPSGTFGHKKTWEESKRIKIKYEAREGLVLVQQGI